MKIDTDLFASLLFPEPCTICGEPLTPSEHPGICRTCAEPVLTAKCRRCGAPNRSYVKRCSNCLNREIFYDEMIYPGLYSGGYAVIVKKAKNNPDSPYGKFLLRRIQEVIVRFLTQIIPESDHREKFILTFIPPDPARRVFSPYLPDYLWRNLKLKKYLKPRLEIKKEKLLRKIASTPAQKELPREKRLENLVGKFKAKHNLSGEKILLLDDVATTGSTLNEGARALKEAGASRIVAIPAAFSYDPYI